MVAIFLFTHEHASIKPVFGRLLSRPSTGICCGNGKLSVWPVPASTFFPLLFTLQQCQPPGDRLINVVEESEAVPVGQLQ
jgi:hypothetical protein